MDTLKNLNILFEKSFAQCGLSGFPPLAMSAQHKHLGDYQINGVMAAAKALGKQPQELALQVAEVLKGFTEIASAEAVNGFVNIRLSFPFVKRMLKSAHIISQDGNGLVWVVDYSSPNIAKQMHIGHLRSSVLGDSLCRIFEKKGISLIRQNHIGDAGSQFGLLYAYAKREGVRPQSMPEMESLYVAANSAKAHDAGLVREAAAATSGLQNQDADVLEFWRHLRSLSLTSLHETYRRLGLSLDESHVCGEASYYDDLPPLVEELKQQGIAYESQGAWVVDAAGLPVPTIIQKSDGAYLYATTDLAALKKRLWEMKADKVVYVTDSRQQQHFKAVFDIAKQAAWVIGDTQVEHVAFGVMTDEDDQPFQTRKGANLKLDQLLDESQQAALAVLKTRFGDKGEDSLSDDAGKLGVAAVKYAELNRKRDKNYRFDWDTMLAFNGNTAPYLLYSLARAVKVMDKAENPKMSNTSIDTGNRQLALKLIQYGDELNRAFEQRMPHFLAQYLYDLAGEFNRFYESVNVLNQERPNSTLYFYHKFITIMKDGLQLLGIPIIAEL